jgi:hypothetical protein
MYTRELLERAFADWEILELDRGMLRIQDTAGPVLVRLHAAGVV